MSVRLFFVCARLSLSRRLCHTTHEKIGRRPLYTAASMRATLARCRRARYVRVRAERLPQSGIISDDTRYRRRIMPQPCHYRREESLIGADACRRRRKEGRRARSMANDDASPPGVGRNSCSHPAHSHYQSRRAGLAARLAGIHIYYFMADAPTFLSHTARAPITILRPMPFPPGLARRAAFPCDFWRMQICYH